MPGGDGTGPGGMGPMTGRAAGYCAGYGVPGYMNPGPGYGGYWGGRGRRGGWRNWYRATGMPGYARAARGMPAYGGPTAAPYGYAPPQGGYGYNPYGSPEQELDALKQQAEYMEQNLSDIRERIQELEKEAE